MPLLKAVGATNLPFDPADLPPAVRGRQVDPWSDPRSARRDNSNAYKRSLTT
jgi:hypothetical protein